MSERDLSELVDSDFSPPQSLVIALGPTQPVWLSAIQLALMDPFIHLYFSPVPSSARDAAPCSEQTPLIFDFPFSVMG